MINYKKPRVYILLKKPNVQVHTIAIVQCHLCTGNLQVYYAQHKKYRVKVKYLY